MSVSNVCPACGAVNAPSNLFCIHCGTRLGGVAASGAGAPPGMPTAAPAPYAAYPSYPAYPYVPVPMPRRATVGTILGDMFDVWTKNFVNFFLVFLLLSLILGVIGSLLAFALFATFSAGGGIIPGSLPSGVTGVGIGTLLLYLIAVAVIGAIVNSIVMGGMTEYAVRRHRGESITLSAALRRGFDKFLSILGANILLTLILLGLFIAPLVLFLALVIGVASGASVPALIGLLFLALIVGGVLAVFFYIALSLYAPAIMMENASAVSSLSRSWAITKGYRGSLFVAILIAAILTFLITGAITFPAGLAGNWVVNLVASAIASGIVGAWSLILLAVAYDLIVRQPSSLFGAPPPYMAGPAIAPPPGAAQTPPSPPLAPPPGGP